ncbi:MAG TPA: Na/Pi cotransporter, partial [Bacteroidales bacterium]|nr:Na/Pi cotransporter [Bacteroidales bacterium]
MSNANLLLDMLTILGALTLFLFGMKMMSESLQRISGRRLRNIFTNIASNRVKAIVAGLLVTGIIQSSSAVTVMLVSFLNAGLFSLTQALGIMMGANIGTTITAWLITIFGFKF